jgi:ribonucleoside-diphosphate reductase alpha chain
MHIIKNQNQQQPMTYSKYEWLNKDSREFLSRGYIKGGISAEERIRQIADTAESILGIKGFSDKFEDYISKGWISLSTPVWANFGLRALPISCYTSYTSDTMHDILHANSEIGMMSKHGGGTALYLGDIRPRGSAISSGGMADGPVHFARLTDTIVDIAKQADTRRGSCAVYLPVEHKDIEEFLQIKHEGNPIQNLQYGVTVTDEWMQSMIDGDMSKRKVWAKVLSSRSDIGFPYIIFIDNANNAAPKEYKDKGKKVYCSNLCSEIMLSIDNTESFVCCLSSVNLYHFDEWKDTDLVETMIYFLDAVMSEFIQKAKAIPYMERAVKFAEEQRALGLGVLGWHSYLQKNMVPIESMEAKLINVAMFKSIKTKADKASVELAELFGSPLLLENSGRRNVTTMAIAPTKSSSFILGQISMGIEPIKSNYFIKDLAKSKTVYKNQELVKLLDFKGINTKSIWDSILSKGGSVQHLDELTDKEKMVFKTFVEISQLELVQQNSARQKYVDQGISFNLAIHPSVPTKDINKLYIEAWKLGLKSLYYQFSENSAQAFARDINDCVSCES